MRGERDGSTSLTGVANEYSVTPWNGGFVLISQDSTEAFSGKIRIWHSRSPFGPFAYRADNDLVYRMPEPGPYGSYWDGDIIAYNAHVHPSLRRRLPGHAAFGSLPALLEHVAEALRTGFLDVWGGWKPYADEDGYLDWRQE